MSSACVTVERSEPIEQSEDEPDDGSGGDWVDQPADETGGTGAGGDDGDDDDDTADETGGDEGGDSAECAECFNGRWVQEGVICGASDIDTWYIELDPDGTGRHLDCTCDPPVEQAFTWELDDDQLSRTIAEGPGCQEAGTVLTNTLACDGDTLSLGEDFDVTRDGPAPDLPSCEGSGWVVCMSDAGQCTEVNLETTTLTRSEFEESCLADPEGGSVLEQPRCPLQTWQCAGGMATSGGVEIGEVGLTWSGAFCAMYPTTDLPQTCENIMGTFSGTGSPCAG